LAGATDRLFFALYPDPAAASRISTLAERLRHDLGLHGRPIAAARLHVTLCYLGDHVGLPDAIVAAATAAAARIDAPAFELAFDKVASFPRVRGDRPLVLQGGTGIAALKRFERDLGAALEETKAAGGPERPYAPHVTLLYDAACLDETTVEPVSWIAREFVLVHSRIGQGKHVTLGRWPLRASHERALR
jgi:2'-5' RNA ligase